MNLDEMMQEIAAGLRDAIRETPYEQFKEDPEDAYTDLACRLVFRLSEKLTITPNSKNEAADRIRVQQAEAARRIFDILTGWMVSRPGRSCVTGISPSGRFELTMRAPDGTQGYFQGGSVQDVYAQAAQTICLEAT